MTIRDQFRATCQRRYDKTTLPQLGEVRAQSLTEAERMEIEFAKLDENGQVCAERARLTTARMIVAQIVDGEGKQVFTADDLTWLAEMDSAVAGPVREWLNEFNKQDQPSQANLDDAKKNSKETPG